MMKIKFMQMRGTTLVLYRTSGLVKSSRTDLMLYFMINVGYQCM